MGFEPCPQRTTNVQGYEVTAVPFREKAVKLSATAVKCSIGQIHTYCIWTRTAVNSKPCTFEVCCEHVFESHVVTFIYSRLILLTALCSGVARGATGAMAP